MSGFALTRRREITLPTLFGVLILLLLFLLTGLFAVRHAYGYLSLDEPKPGARLLVVEGWLGARQLDRAVEAYRQGQYQQVVTTGGPVEPRLGCITPDSYADLARDYLQAHGIAAVAAVPAPASAQDRTFLSAVMVREWMRSQGRRDRAVDVYSAGPHARRTRVVYGLALGSQVEVGIMSAPPEEYDASHWWRTSAGAKAVVGESISLLWTACCFFPPAPGTHEEKWGTSH